MIIIHINVIFKLLVAQETIEMIYMGVYVFDYQELTYFI